MLSYTIGNYLIKRQKDRKVETFYSDNNSNYKWEWYITEQCKLQNRWLIYESMLYNVLSNKFCQSNHISN